MIGKWIYPLRKHYYLTLKEIASIFLGLNDQVELPESNLL